MKQSNLINEQNNNKNIWISQEEASTLLYINVQTLRKNCRKGLFSFQVKKINKKTVYYVLLNSLPVKYQEKYFSNDVVDESTINNTYSESPDWAKLQAEKYLMILNQCKNLYGSKLKEFIADWNKNNPNLITSYQSINRMRKRLELYGVSGLLAKFGKRSGETKIKETHFNYFKNLCLIEGAPSFYSCWEITRGFAIRKINFQKMNFLAT